PQYLKVFPGAKECIETLSRKGFILGVLSNKIKEAIIDGFDFVGFPNRFDLILGYEDLKHPKPDPEGLLKMKAMFHDEVVMVGDSIYDMEVARRAGSESIGVTWGNTSRTQLCDAGATWIASSFEELLQILSSYSPL
ncbi:MAG: HAD family hydrolase, partial [Bacilli bacterium]